MTNPQSAFVELMGMVRGYQRSRALMVAVELGIPDVLGDDTRGVGELAAATETHAPTLYRLLRALAAVGVFEEHEGERFSLTDMGRCLRTDRPLSAGAFARFFGRDYQWAAWGALEHSVRTGENAARHVLGSDVWTFREQHPEENEIFNRAMQAGSSSTAAQDVAAFDFGRCATVADVGGGTGALLAAILKAHPGVRGVLFDQAHVVAEAPPVLAAAGVADRVTIIEGSFFETVPAGCDGYVLRRIIHDWPDKESLDILRVCRAAMTPDARLIIADFVVGPPNTDAESKFFDLLMLVSAGGRERTEPEWRDLLGEAGFEVERIKRSSPISHAIIAAPR